MCSAYTSHGKRAATPTLFPSKFHPLVDISQMTLSYGRICGWHSTFHYREQFCQRPSLVLVVKNASNCIDLRLYFKTFSSGDTPDPGHNWGGIKPPPRLLPLLARPPSHFFRASTSAASTRYFLDAGRFRTCLCVYIDAPLI